MKIPPTHPKIGIYWKKTKMNFPFWIRKIVFDLGKTNDVIQFSLLIIIIQSNKHCRPFIKR